MKYKVEGRYFEECEVGDEYESGGRTITEADIVIFAGLSGDYNPLHTNEEFAKKSVFGTRVAHGPLIHAISVGLLNQMPFFEGTVVAMRGYRNVVYTKGVFAGDTIFVKAEIVEKNDGGKPGWGEIVYDVDIINQKGEVCSKSTRVFLIKKKGDSKQID